MCYSYGLSVINSHVLKGASILLTSKTLMERDFWTFLKSQKATSIAGVPYTYKILDKLRFIGMDLPSLKTLTQAGGKLNDKLNREFAEFCLHSGKQFFVMYGQTEATARISCMEPERWEEKPGSVGRPLDNLRVSIVDENGNDLPPGEVGELLVRGPSICPGYWRDAEATQRVFQNGGLRTRDLAREDDEGYLWIVGRKEAFLKMRGIRVSFAEVEERVAAMPGVDECATVAVDHPEAGEAMVLFIVPEPNARIVEEEVRRRLPAHWALDSIRLVSELPKTSAGKIARSLLVAEGKEAPCSN